MANFHTHVGVAMVGSALASAGCIEQGLASHPEAFLLFCIGSLAGILPDIDSDHSVPTRLLFKWLSILSVILMFLATIGQMHIVYSLALSLLSSLGVYYVIYPIFASITVHRGLFHSLPAALLLGLSVAALSLYILKLPFAFSWLVACFSCAGYILHLLLDELYSVDFMGRTLKGSFGSAATIFSPSFWRSYTLMYGAVGVGFYYLPLPDYLHTLVPAIG
ncbi:MAG: metal-dependent hydrolase [Mariprofundaceae bacterium]